MTWAPAAQPKQVFNPQALASVNMLRDLNSKWLLQLTGVFHNRLPSACGILLPVTESFGEHAPIAQKAYGTNVATGPF